MKNNKVVVSVPGKIHLMGEHAVVYGKPALISAINYRLYSTITESSDGFQIISQAEKNNLIERAVEVVVRRLQLSKKPKVKIEISSQIPIGWHAGSSAAVSVAVVSSLIYFLRKIWDPNLFNELAYEVEKFQHGNPSGGDNTAVTFGGFIWYRKELEFLKSIFQLTFRTSSCLAPFLLIDTGRPKEHTGEMVSLVSKFMKKYSEKGEKLLNENEKAVKDVVIALRQGNEKLLIKAIRSGQKTLEDLGVVSDKVIPFIKEVEKNSGAVKICGGGGKRGSVGFLLCYIRDREKIKSLSQKYHFTLRSVLLGEEGVRLESRKN